MFRSFNLFWLKEWATNGKIGRGNHRSYPFQNLIDVLRFNHENCGAQSENDFLFHARKTTFVDCPASSQHRDSNVFFWIFLENCVIKLAKNSINWIFRKQNVQNNGFKVFSCQSRPIAASDRTKFSSSWSPPSNKDFNVIENIKRDETDKVVTNWLCSDPHLPINKIQLGNMMENAVWNVSKKNNIITWSWMFLWWHVGRKRSTNFVWLWFCFALFRRVLKV